MSLALYETDDTTLAASHAFPSTTPGSTSTAKGWHLWADKGTPGNTYRSVRASIEAEVSAGVWAETGISLVDRQELQARVTGSANPQADPAFAARSAGGWVPLGAGAALELGDIRGDCAVYLEVRHAPGIETGTGSVTSNWRIRLTSGTRARGRVDYGGPCGIISGVGDSSRDEWNDATAVTPTGTPDAVVHIGARSYLAAGVDASEVADTVTLDQDDANAAALTTGEAYVAVVSQPLAGGASVATKGVKAVAAAAVPPALPAGHLASASVLVQYGAGGSAIDAGDITTLALPGRARLAYGAASLDVTVGRLRALLPTSYVDVTSTTTLTLPATETSILYVDSLGVVAAAVAASVPAGVLRLWSATTDGSGVTSVTDLRVGTRPATLETL